MKNQRKSPWIGCLFYLILITPAYFFTSWQVATSTAVLITVLMILFGGIDNEIKKMRKLKNTPRTVISNAPKHGYIKLLARVKPKIAGLKTFLTNEAADYRWISFQYAYTNEKRDADGSSRYESGWSSFYDDETNLKTLEIFDGTSSCFVSLHNAHYYINKKEKQLTARELLHLIKEKGFQNVPLDSIKEDQKLKVVERWIKKDQPITFYGTMNKLPLDHIPNDIIKAADKALKYGPDDDTRKRDRERILNQEDWKTLMHRAKEEGATTLDILTSDYTNTAENELVLNVKDNKVLNQNSYIAMGIYLLSIALVVFMWYGFVNSEYPEFFKQLLTLIN